MDAAGLRSRIASTLDANAEVRRQAEIELKVVRGRLCQRTRNMSGHC